MPNTTNNYDNDYDWSDPVDCERAISHMEREIELLS